MLNLWDRLFVLLVHKVGGIQSLFEIYFLLHAHGCYGAKQGGKHSIFDFFVPQMHFFGDGRFSFRVNFSGTLEKNTKLNFYGRQGGKSRVFLENY